MRVDRAKLFLFMAVVFPVGAGVWLVFEGFPGDNSFRFWLYLLTAVVTLYLWVLAANHWNRKMEKARKAGQDIAKRMSDKLGDD